MHYYEIMYALYVYFYDLVLEIDSKYQNHILKKGVLRFNYVKSVDGL